MILLDTNVVSEAMRPAPAPRVIAWLDSLPASDVWISSVTVAEIHAIARTGGLTLATRNIKDFAGIQGLESVNPWSGPK